MQFKDSTTFNGHSFMPGAILSILKTRWVLLVVVAVFVAFKIPQLGYPFYIDEGWVYAPAVKMMAAHGPGLLPGALPPEYSRGHPLMFPFLCGLWIKCFGSSHVAMHAFPLLLSVIFLVLLFECCLRLLGRPGAMLVLLLVATRVIFFVQSSFVYPEVLLAMGAFLSLYFYSKRRLLPASLSLFLLFFTKEGGLVFGAVIGIDAFVGMFSSSLSRSKRLLTMITVLVPACAIAAFYLLQKVRLGWYILPEHTGLIKTTWADYYFMLRRGIYWTFRGDAAMYMLALFILLLSAIPAVRLRDQRYLFLAPAAFIIYFLADENATNSTGSIVLVLLFLFSIAFAVYSILRINTGLSSAAQKFVVLSAVSVVVYVLYSSLTQVGYRYLLAPVILILIIYAISIQTILTVSGRQWLYPSIAGILVIGAYGFYAGELADRTEDSAPGAFHAMSVQEQDIAFLESENAYDQEIAVGCSWEVQWFSDAMHGFLHTSRTFTCMKRFPPGPGTQYIIFGNTCGDEAGYEAMKANPSFHSVFKARDGIIWAEIFKRKP